MEQVLLRRFVMGSRFEILVLGSDSAYLLGAAEEAFEEVKRVDRMLSVYREDSEISRINALAAKQAVLVSTPVFELLERCQELYRLTDRAFDITIGPLLRVWGAYGGSVGELPAPEKLAEAKAAVGMNDLLLDRSNRTVRFRKPGMMIDLGGIGKGYAVDCAVEVLKEAGIQAGFVHAGGSTMFGWGEPSPGSRWKVRIPTPEEDRLRQSGSGEGGKSGSEALQALSYVELRDQALSVSSVFRKALVRSGKVYGHVIDPKTGYPVQRALLSAVRMDRATDADALSTALLVLGLPGLSLLRRHFSRIEMLLVYPTDSKWRAVAAGLRLELYEGPAKVK